MRDTILASWWRSRRWNVAADHIDLSYTGDPDLDTPLTRSALPVLRHLREHLDGQPISVILTDAAGVVLTRLAADHDLDRHLDSVQLAPGFSYAEESVGTNGIGTALEGGRPMHVFGHEHYAENLEDLACAGVPIRHPISGKTVGAVDLTCWRKDADPLLITLAKTTADQITQALLTDSDAREFELLQEYLRACRHSAGIVLALNHDVVMMNEHARQVLDPGDQAVLLGQATETLASRHSGAVVVELPTGVTARMYCRPVRGDDRLAGGVVHVKLVEAGCAASAEPVQQARMVLPGLVGSGSLWLRGCHQVEAVYDSGDWLALQGEPGVGKLAVLRAVHQRRNPAGRFHVLDAAEAADQDWLATVRRELLDGTGALVIRHVDRLSARRLHALSAALQETQAAGRQDALWVAVTLGHGAPAKDVARSAAVLPQHGGAAAAPPSHRGPARPRAVPARQARPLRPPGLLARGDADPAAVKLAGQHRAALAGPAAGGPAPAHRDDPAGRPAAGVLDSQPPAAQPAGVDGARRDRAEPARLTRATRSRPPSRWACPGRRSTARSTSTA